VSMVYVNSMRGHCGIADEYDQLGHCAIAHELVGVLGRDTSSCSPMAVGL
jgi:hypothetical protein